MQEIVNIAKDTALFLMWVSIALFFLSCIGAIIATIIYNHKD